MACTSSKWGKFWLWSTIWPWRSRSIIPQNNRALNQGFWHLWSKFGDPSLNGWWVIARTNSWLTDTRTHTHTQATTIPEGQNWPRVKIVNCVIHQCCDKDDTVFLSRNKIKSQCLVGQGEYWNQISWPYKTRVPTHHQHWNFLTFSSPTPNFLWVFAAWKYILTCAGIHMGHTNAWKVIAVIIWLKISVICHLYVPYQFNYGSIYKMPKYYENTFPGFHAFLVGTSRLTTTSWHSKFGIRPSILILTPFSRRFPDLLVNFEISWPISNFPDFFLTFYDFHFLLTFSWPVETMKTKEDLKKWVKCQGCKCTH